MEGCLWDPHSDLSVVGQFECSPLDAYLRV